MTLRKTRTSFEGAYPCRVVVISVDVVYPIAGIQICIGRHAGSYVGHRDCPTEVLCVVEQFELIEMGMTEELSRDGCLVP